MTSAPILATEVAETGRANRKRIEPGKMKWWESTDNSIRLYLIYTKDCLMDSSSTVHTFWNAKATTEVHEGEMKRWESTRERHI